MTDTNFTNSHQTIQQHASSVTQFVTIRVIGVVTALPIPLFIPVAQSYAQTQAAMNAQARAEFVKVDAELNRSSSTRPNRFWCGRRTQSRWRMGFQDSPPGVRVVSRGAVVCFWNGSGFDKVFLPENLPVPDIKFPNKKGGYEKPYGGGVKPLRWSKSGDLEMSSEDEVMLRGKTYTGVLHFTISFDAQHHPSVKKIGKTKTEVSE